MQQKQANEKGVLLHAEFKNIGDGILDDEDQIISATSNMSPIIHSDYQRVV